MTDVLFCTDRFHDRYADRLAGIAPGLDVVRLVEGDVVADADLDRITLACFSGDTYPDRAPSFMRVCLSAPNLQWLHTFSAGVDHPVFDAFRDRGVAITTSSGSSASPIAQTVMMYLLALTRDLPGWLADQAAHRWSPRAFRELDGMTIGVVGMGPIGREVVRLAQAFRMHPIALRRTVQGDEPCETWTFDRLTDLAAAVDALVLAAPLTDDTRGAVDAAVLAAMRPGALLVNVARGEIVDEDALVEALRTGRIGGAALDVFANEPLPDDSPLWDLPNVIVTPHSSGTSPTAHERGNGIFLDNLARWVAGEPLRNRVA